MCLVFQLLPFKLAALPYQWVGTPVCLVPHLYTGVLGPPSAAAGSVVAGLAAEHALVSVMYCNCPMYSIAPVSQYNDSSGVMTALTASPSKEWTYIDSIGV